MKYPVRNRQVLTNDYMNGKWERGALTMSLQDRLEKAFEQAKANMELEGYTITEEDEREILAVLSGKKKIHQLIDELTVGE